MYKTYLQDIFDCCLLIALQVKGHPLCQLLMDGPEAVGLGLEHILHTRTTERRVRGGHTLIHTMKSQILQKACKLGMNCFICQTFVSVDLRCLYVLTTADYSV